MYCLRLFQYQHTYQYSKVGFNDPRSPESPQEEYLGHPIYGSYPVDGDFYTTKSFVEIFLVRNYANFNIRRNAMFILHERYKCFTLMAVFSFLFL